jgi:hypothetical protein
MARTSFNRSVWKTCCIHTLSKFATYAVGQSSLSFLQPTMVNANEQAVAVVNVRADEKKASTGGRDADGQTATDPSPNLRPKK